MSARVRIVIAIIVAVVALYFVIAQPEAAASLVREVVAGIVSAFGSIVRFFQTLFSPGLGG